MRLAFIMILISYGLLASAQCVADFEYDATALNVSFQNTSQLDDGEVVVNILWEFGDGAQGNTFNPSHIYLEAGEYEVSLSFTTSTGCFATVSKTIFICEVETELTIDDNCDDGYIDANIAISDTHNNALPVQVNINGVMHSQVNDAGTISIPLRADGSDYNIEIFSIAHPNCRESLMISAPTCVLPCFLSDISARISNSNTYSVAVTDQGFEPAAINIRAGDYVLFDFQSDGKSSTNINDSNNQNWDSGLLNAGDTFLLYSYDPGIYRYTSLHSPDGEFEATMVSSCADSIDYMLQLNFSNAGQPLQCQVIIDNVPYGNTFTAISGQNQIEVPLPKDGLMHTYVIQSKEDATCSLETQWQAPICGEASLCNIHIEASQSGICTADSMVTVNIDLLSSGIATSTYNLMLDGELLLSNQNYFAGQSSFEIMLPGDGQMHTISIQDNNNPDCNASTSITVEDCANACAITEMQAGIGSTNVFLINVNDDSFLPKDITISAGDRVLWQWQTDSMRSVTALDFSFDSGIRTEGYAYTSPYLPVGVHRYYSEFSDMTGSITVEPNCVDGQVPAYYSFMKDGGAQNGYNVYFNGNLTSGSPYNYSDSGFNTASFSIAGDGQTHSIIVQDVLDTTCQVMASFEAPSCDQSVCAIFIEEPTMAECNAFNNVELSIPVFSFNVDTTVFDILVDGQLQSNPGVYHSEGETRIDLILPGDGATHEIVIRDAKEWTCTDTLIYQTEACMLPCDIQSVALNYAKESVQDSCWDGEANISLEIKALPIYDSRLIIEMTSDSGDLQKDTLAYPPFDPILLSYNYLADGRNISFSIFDLNDADCAWDTTFQLMQCDPDPCAITISDIDYSVCRDSGYMDMTIAIDTFRVQDSMALWLDSVEIFRGSYAGFTSNNTFPIQWTGEERVLTIMDLSVDSCTTAYPFFTQYCPVDCYLVASYSLQDSCILASDTSYQIILSVESLNAASDSVYLEVLGSEIMDRNMSYDSLLSGYVLDIPISNNSIVLGLYDTGNNECRSFVSVNAPDCILQCDISIDSVQIQQRDKEYITITEQGYEPITLDAQVGDTVVFVNQTNITHVISSISNHAPHIFVSGGIAPGASYNVILDTLDIINYSSSTITQANGDIITGSINIGHECIDGQAPIDIFISSEYPFSDSIVLSIDSEMNTLLYPSNGVVSSFIDGSGEEVDIALADLINPNCADDIVIQSPTCEYNCDELNVSIFTEIDTFNRTVQFYDQSNGMPNSWLWNFGDGQASVLKNPSHTYNAPGEFEVCLEIKNETENCVDLQCISINIPDIRCEALFEVVVDELAISFEDKSTSEADISTRKWTLNEVIIVENGATGNYTVPSSGNYELCLEITTSTGCTDTYCETLELKELCDIIASFNYEQNHDTLSFFNTSMGTATGMIWDIEGEFILGDTIQYVFEENGNYNVCLIVENTSIPDVCIDTICQEINIDVCRADATFVHEAIQDSLFAEIIQPLDENDMVSWDFGNGFSSSLNPVAYQFSAEGTYTVCAEISDPDYENCIDVHCEEIEIIISSTEDLSADNIRLYPNPISLGKDINISHTENIDKVSLLNTNGELIFEQSIYKTKHCTIATKSLQQGIYQIQIHAEDGIFHRKVLIVE